MISNAAKCAGAIKTRFAQGNEQLSLCLFLFVDFSETTTELAYLSTRPAPGGFSQKPKAPASY